jgi:S-adenosylmethionine hydrolase
VFEQRASQSGVIALLTDFGLSGPYVGQMKSALLRHAPHARILDLCHDVRVYDVLQAAFFLEASRPYLPGGAIMLVVVDPGVGSSRRLLGVEAFDQVFLGPDNGLFTLLLQAIEHENQPSRAVRLRIDAENASATFHGRDILAPIAARLALGVELEELGRSLPLQEIVRLDLPRPLLDEEGLRTRVLHVDRFGNCVLQLPSATWASVLNSWPEIWLKTPAQVALSSVRAYPELAPGQAGVLAGSQGYLELALNLASAAARFGLTPGDAVLLSQSGGKA